MATFIPNIDKRPKKKLSTQQQLWWRTEFQKRETVFIASFRKDGVSRALVWMSAQDIACVGVK